MIAEYRKKILIGAILAVIITSGLAATAIWVSPNTSAKDGPSATGLVLNDFQSQLIVELTDPPVVPQGTTSLSLTYSEIDLSIAAPGSGNSIQTISIVPAGNSATIDLLSLQNVSQTLALSSLETGSQIVSVTFVVSRIQIQINGTTYPVVLATGGNALLVTLANPPPVEGLRNALLLELNPTIIDTSSGYQMVPSSLGFFKPQSEITPNEGKIGYVKKLSGWDQGELHHARGSISARLVSLSVSGSVTTMSVQVINTGKVSERLVLFGISGDFTPICGTASMSDSSRQNRNRYCHNGPEEVILIPGEPHIITPSTTVSSCEPRHMSLVNPPDIENDLTDPIVMNPGQCLMFSFSGVLSFGNHAIVPSTAPGKKYIVHVFATNGADVKLTCTLQSPPNFSNCAVDTGNNDDA